MTYERFKRLKPKYKCRLIMAGIIVVILFVGFLFLLSALFSLVGSMMNTHTLEGITASNILEKPSMLKIASTIGQTDTELIVVLECDGRFLRSDETYAPELTHFEMRVVDLKDKKSASTWKIYADEKKATVQLEKNENSNLSSLTMRRLSFASYYPALSRVTCENLLDTLEQNYPESEGGVYSFSGHFDNDIQPAFSAYFDQDLRGFWVSMLEAISEFGSTFRFNDGACVPLILSIEAVDTERSTASRKALLEPEECCVLLMECGVYSY